MSRKAIAERLQQARRANEWRGYDWWREVYIQDVSELLPEAREIERLRTALTLRDHDVEDLEQEIERLKRIPEELLGTSSLGEEPLAYWGGFRAGLVEVKDRMRALAREEQE